MINNQSNKPENREPADSEQKNIKHPENDEEAVLKPEDKKYKKEEANFDNPARQREEDEQPVHPVKKEPEE